MNFVDFVVVLLGGCLLAAIVCFVLAVVFMVNSSQGKNRRTVGILFLVIGFVLAYVAIRAISSMLTVG